MINIRVPEEKDKKKIIDLLTKEQIQINNLDIDSLNNSMIVCDDDKVVGYSNYIEISDSKTALIDKLVIEGEYRGQYIGDGLIKALLNLADKRQIKKVFAIDMANNSLFYKKVGLTKREIMPSKEMLEYLGKDINIDETIEVFEAVLPDFFNKSCKSKS